MHMQLTPDIFKDLKEASHTTLDPTKIHLFLLDSKAPDEYVRQLGTQLSTAGVFAILITDPRVKVFSTFPVAVAQPSMDVSNTLHSFISVEENMRSIGAVGVPVIPVPAVE